jgi:hypothetical protein
MANQYTKKTTTNPHFNLKPQDNFTPILIQKWINLAVQHGVDEAKVEDARNILKNVEEWRRKNPTLCKTPD